MQKPDLQFLSPSQCNQLMKLVLDMHEELTDICICGEVRNLRFYQLGQQIYFTLADDQSQLNCVVFSTFLKNITCELKEGQQILVRGSLKWMVKKGTVSFQVVYAKAFGKGLLQQELEARKEKLKKEGLFDPERKKKIPQFPSTVVLITALDSAAQWDFVHVLHQSAPYVKIKVIPTVMQGALCAGSVVQSLQTAQHCGGEVIVLTRGGGSAEELMGFNAEEVVRAIAGSRCPVISAIGHEVDTTLSDWAADLRASTPTDAAKVLAQSVIALRQELLVLKESSRHILFQKHQETLQQLQEMKTHLDLALHQKFEDTQGGVTALIHRLKQCDPLLKLRQGFSILRSVDTQKVIRSVDAVVAQQSIQIQLEDGTVEAVVQAIEKVTTR